MSAEPKACVFWDVVDFPFPNGLDPDLIYENMKLVLEKMDYLGELSIMAYVDKETFADELLHAYKKAGVTILPRQVAGDEYARVHNMTVDIVLWAMENPATYFEPLGLMVISKNIKEETDFLRVLEALKERYYNVILALPQELPSTKLRTINWECFWGPHTVQGVDHTPKSREESPFPKGIGYLRDEDPALCDVVIFWDVEGCPTDKDNLFSTIVPALGNKGYYGEVSIMSYVNDREAELSRQGVAPVTITIVTKGEDEYAKVNKMLLDMLFWAINNDDVPTHFMLISKPSKYIQFDRVVKALEARGSHVIFALSHDIELPLSTDSFASLPDRASYEIELPLSPDTLPDSEVQSYLDLLKISDSQVEIFWNVEDYPPTCPNFIYSCMKKTLTKKGYTDSVWLSAYVNDVNLTNIPAISGMKINFVPERIKYDKVTTMLVDMLMFANNRHICKERSLIVISKPIKDEMFDRVVRSLRDEGFSVLSAQLDYMVTFGTALWSHRSLFDWTAVWSPRSGNCVCRFCRLMSIRRPHIT